MGGIDREWNMPTQGRSLLAPIEDEHASCGQLCRDRIPGHLQSITVHQATCSLCQFTRLVHRAPVCVSVVWAQSQVSPARILVLLACREWMVALEVAHDSPSTTSPHHHHYISNYYSAYRTKSSLLQPTESSNSLHPFTEGKPATSGLIAHHSARPVQCPSVHQAYAVHSKPAIQLSGHGQEWPPALHRDQLANESADKLSLTPLCNGAPMAAIVMRPPRPQSIVPSSPHLTLRALLCLVTLLHAISSHSVLCDRSRYCKSMLAIVLAIC